MQLLLTDEDEEDEDAYYFAIDVDEIFTPSDTNIICMSSMQYLRSYVAARRKTESPICPSISNAKHGIGKASNSERERNASKTFELRRNPYQRAGLASAISDTSPDLVQICHLLQ
jgi:hypothetical protein